MTTDLERLVGLARITRGAFERVARMRSYPKDLGGLCHCASSFLARLAEAHGIEVELGRGIGHWFVLYGGTIIVDVTATQFGVKEKIVVLLVDKARKRGEWWDLQDTNSVFDGHYHEEAAKTVEEAMGLGIGEAEL